MPILKILTENDLDEIGRGFELRDFLTGTEFENITDRKTASVIISFFKMKNKKIVVPTF